MNGYLLIDKPKGWTSFDVVAKVRNLAKQALQEQAKQGLLPPGHVVPKRVKTGHTGTLDPLATGLLVVLVGTYTKRATELTKLDKTYEVTMRLGQTSTTGDAEGEISAGTDYEPRLDELASAMQSFVGDIMQTPPAYSAMKINGQRAYQLARAGKEVVLEPRPARIDRLEINRYEYPLAYFTVDVSSGTYIRSLVEDIGKRLGTGAYMSGLRRTRIGAFRLEDAQDLAVLSPGVLAGSLKSLKALAAK